MLKILIAMIRDSEPITVEHNLRSARRQPPSLGPLPIRLHARHHELFTSIPRHFPSHMCKASAHGGLETGQMRRDD